MKKKMTVPDFAKYKAAGRKFTSLTAYDYTTAGIVNASDTDVIIVGDSLGTVMLGYGGTVPVTMDEMLAHLRPVAKGAPQTFIVGDLPFGSYNADIADAIRNATLMLKAGADAVKLEGGEFAETISAVVRAGIPVVAHLGLTPQTASQLGGYKVQGGSPASAQKLVQAAQAVEAAGAFALVVECVPSGVAQAITRALTIPVLGIGAGAFVDGQVLVLQDMLGMFGDFKPKFVKKYRDLRAEMVAALNEFHQETATGAFPTAEYSFNATVEGFEA
ncbi:3-methyl-2-oxobutanoate hydroxymethyltransferase [Planctomycetales bacterium]|nr:3-methyl-2-oxobutanoate hydroxymethyltransferase [Planctomycetales bacterium]